MHCYRCDHSVRASTKRCRCGCVAFYRGDRPGFSLRVLAERAEALAAEADKLKGAMLLGEGTYQAEPRGWREITARRRARPR